MTTRPPLLTGHLPALENPVHAIVTVLLAWIAAAAVFGVVWACIGYLRNTPPTGWGAPDDGDAPVGQSFCRSWAPPSTTTAPNKPPTTRNHHPRSTR